MREAARLIAESERPVLYVGGGVIRARRTRSCASWPSSRSIPVVTTLMARGAFPDSHPLHLGMPGMHGTVAAVGALQRSDLLISLGARFDDRVTGRLDSFAPDAKVIHADIDPAEISKNRHADVPIVGDCREVIADLIVAVQAEYDAGTPRRRSAVARDRARPGASSTRSATTRTRTRCRRSTSSSGSARSTGPEATYVAGVGQHQMWAAHFVTYERPRSVDQLRRPRHDGLRRPGRDGREGRRRPTAPSGRSTATAASR